MPRVRLAVAHERREQVLAFLASCANDAGVADVSLHAISRACNLTFTQTRSVLKYLVGSGLLQVEHRQLPNGGFAENSYRLT